MADYGRRQLASMLHELHRRPRSPAQLADRLPGLRDATRAPPSRGMASRSGLDPSDERLATLESLGQVPPDRRRAEEERYERLLSEALCQA